MSNFMVFKHLIVGRFRLKKRTEKHQNNQKNKTNGQFFT